MGAYMWVTRVYLDFVPVIEAFDIVAVVVVATIAARISIHITPIQIQSYKSNRLRATEPRRRVKEKEKTNWNVSNFVIVVVHSCSHALRFYVAFPSHILMCVLYVIQMHITMCAIDAGPIVFLYIFFQILFSGAVHVLVINRQNRWWHSMVFNSETRK